MSYTTGDTADFEVFRVRGWKLWISRRFPPHALGRAEAPDGHNGLRGPFDRVKSSRFSRVYRCRIGFFGTAHSLYLKQFLHRSAWDMLKHIFRPSRAKRAFKASLMLAENGLLSPEVIAVGEFRGPMLTTKAFLLTQELENAKSLYAWAHDNRKAHISADLRDKREFIDALGGTIGRMHSAGIFHGDLRPGNIFAEEYQGKWRFFFLDNERTRKFWRLPHRLIVKNLVQIGMLHKRILTPTDRMRFLKSYLARNTRLGPDYRKLAAEVFSRTQGRMAGKKSFGDFTRQQ